MMEGKKRRGEGRKDGKWRSLSLPTYLVIKIMISMYFTDEES
jgi:hypothetical protein